MVATPLRTTFRDDLRDHGPDGRFYWWKGEGPFISVTNALSNGVPKPALTYWSAKVVAEYVGNQWDDAVEMHDRMDTNEFISFLKNKPWGARDKAGDIGTLIHDIAEQYVVGTVPDLSEYDDVVKAKVDQFIDFMDVVKPDVYAIEGVVYNREFMYAGAFDLIVDIEGVGRYIIDIKTGKGVYPEAALQQTAYRYGEFIAVGDEEVPMPKVDGAMILHLMATKWKLIPVVTDESSWFAFRSALHTAKWMTGKGEGFNDSAVGRVIQEGRA